jgi:hypothetical protein
MNDLALLLHMIGIAVGVGSAFSLFVIGIMAKSFDKSYKVEMLYKFFTLRYIAYIGLIVLIISGLFLTTPYIDEIPNMPYFITKLILAGMLLAISIYGTYQMVTAKNKTPQEVLKNLSYAGKIGFILGFLIIVTAVFAFH